MERKVMLVYTGGTIGMKADYENDALVPVDFEHIFNEVPELNKLHCTLEFRSFKKPIDSSDMNPDLWIELAGFIEEHYDEFDGFVILHGSDTMAYTASALSFLLENLDKPVILTGSQLPIGTLRTDGKENLITAIEIASSYKNNRPLVPEVAIYFEYHLYRGNRSRKEDADDFRAFESPNYPLLAEAGVKLNFRSEVISKGHPGEQLVVHKKMSDEVNVLKFFPGMRSDMIQCSGGISGLRALVIETYGSGNAPSNKEIQKALKEIVDRGIIVLNITQCHGGSVEQGKYANGRFLNQIGVISGKDLTTEAALTKLMFLLAQNEDNEEVKIALKKDLRGEMSNGL